LALAKITVKIVVIGAGAWGTGLAISAANHRAAQHQVILWAHRADHAQTMGVQRENQRYLPGLALHPRCRSAQNRWASCCNGMRMHN
jgi:glycerol-3-phosphate dehydrogenase (NAD(P)+)